MSNKEEEVIQKGEITLLVDKVKAGDDNAFEQLTQLVSHNLRKKAKELINKYNKGHITVQPTMLLNDVLVEVYQGNMLSNIMSSDSFNSLAYTIMYRNLIDSIRKRTAKQRGGDLLVPLDDQQSIDFNSNKGISDIDKTILIKEQIEQVKGFMAKLKPVERDVLLLRYAEDLKFEEIAHTIGKTENAVKKDCERAMQKLKVMMSMGTS